MMKVFIKLKNAYVPTHVLTSTMVAYLHYHTLTIKLCKESNDCSFSVDLEDIDHIKTALSDRIIVSSENGIMFIDPRCINKILRIDTIDDSPYCHKCAHSTNIVTKISRHVFNGIHSKDIVSAIETFMTPQDIDVIVVASMDKKTILYPDSSLTF